MGRYETKTKPTAQAVSDFIELVDDPSRRKEAYWIDAMMRRVSGKEPRMWGPSIIGYGDYHYRYATGHEGDSPRIAFSPRKAELVLYLIVTPAAGPSELDALLSRLGKHRATKSCLYVRRLDQVDLAVLEQIAELNWRTMAERYPS